MQRQDGDIHWEVTEVVVDGQSITELRFEKMEVGEYKGQYHPLFYLMPMVLISRI
jgi:hypothetical protein